MSLLPLTPAQQIIESLDVTLDRFLNFTSAAINHHNNFFTLLWGLPDPDLLSTLQVLYDNNRLFYVIDNNVSNAHNLNSVLSAWNFTPSASAISLSAGRNFYLSGGVVVLDT